MAFEAEHATVTPAVSSEKFAVGDRVRSVVDGLVPRLTEGVGTEVGDVVTVRLDDGREGTTPPENLEKLCQAPSGSSTRASAVGEVVSVPVLRRKITDDANPTCAALIRWEQTKLFSSKPFSMRLLGPIPARFALLRNDQFYLWVLKCWSAQFSCNLDVGLRKKILTMVRTWISYGNISELGDVSGSLGKSSLFLLTARPSLESD
jgi:hypothetical protein